MYGESNWLKSIIFNKFDTMPHWQKIIEWLILIIYLISIWPFFQLQDPNKRSIWYKRDTYNFLDNLNFNLYQIAIIIISSSFWLIFVIFKLKNKGQNVVKETCFNILDLGSKMHYMLCLKDSVVYLGLYRGISKTDVILRMVVVAVCRVYIPTRQI
jgi:hypothetical protein